AWLGQPGLALLGREMIAGERGVLRVEGRGGAGASLYAYAPIGSAGWSVAVRVSEAEALGPVYQRARSGVVLLAISLGVIFIAIWMVASRITRPIAQLDEAARSLAAGRLDTPISVDESAADEITVLSHTFAHMARQLSEREEV